RDVAGYAALDATEGGDELVAVTRNDCSALLPVGAAAPERACDVAHCQLRMRCHVVGESTRELTKRFRRACREWHDRVLDVDGRSGGLSFLGRCTLENHVDVGPGEPERADASDTPLCRPGRRLRDYTDGRGVPVDVRVWCAEVQVRRNHPAAQRQHRLDQPGEACRGLEVTDVRLDGA